MDSDGENDWTLHLTRHANYTEVVINVAKSKLSSQKGVYVYR